MTTNYEKILSYTIDELAIWLDNYYGQIDDAPWMNWFSEKYCSKCESVMSYYPDNDQLIPLAWFELEHKCKYFPDMESEPSGETIVKLWLKQEVSD